jgi:hypothetical protein
VWSDVEDCPPFAALANALEQVLDTETADGYRNGPWGFADSAPLAQLVEDSGFADVSVHQRELPVEFEGGPRQLLLTLQATSVASILAQLTEADQLAFVLAVEEATRAITFGGIVRSHATSNIVTAKIGL